MSSAENEQVNKKGTANNEVKNQKILPDVTARSWQLEDQAGFQPQFHLHTER